LWFITPALAATALTGVLDLLFPIWDGELVGYWGFFFVVAIVVKEAREANVRMMQEHEAARKWWQENKHLYRDGRCIRD
jgi:hypothetical protein